jgi:hypothetical protein
LALAVAASGLVGPGVEIERGRQHVGAGALRRVRVAGAPDGAIGASRPFPTATPGWKQLALH